MTENKTDKEIESKFYVRDLAAIEKKLLDINATCLMPRTFEYNLRFDNLKNSLNRQHKVLRLRKSDDVRLTFKGPGENIGGAWSRTEIEIVVNNFDQAQKLLESLGYHVAAVYEKYRAIYGIGTALITLDELPFGKFIEIEAENPDQISRIARQLNLNMAYAIPASYQGLFEQVKFSKNLSVKNLAFWEFKNLTLKPEDLGVTPAD